MASAQLTPAALQAIISSLESGRIAISAGYAAFTLIVFDFFLTLSEECEQMWKRKKNLVFCLFTTLRYATLLYQMTFSMTYFLPFNSTRGCISIIYVEQVCFIFSSAALSGIFALRTFAIYRRNWFILGSLLLLASVKVFISAVDFFVAAEVTTQSSEFHGFGSCIETLTGNSAKWNTTSASLALAFDTLVLGLTLAKTVRTSLDRKKIGLRKSYGYYILRDGLLYYLTIEMLLLFTVIFNQIPSLAIRVARVVIILQTSLAPVLVQRLVLNLRSVDEKIMNGSEDQARSQSLAPIDFAHGSFIGNIGAPLRVGDDDDESYVESNDAVPAELERLDSLEGIKLVVITNENNPRRIYD